MDCNKIEKLLSKSFDGELNAREGAALEEHLRQCDRCRIEEALWSKYEHQMARYYASRKLDEAFVMRIHDRVARLDMDLPKHPRPHLSGRVNILAIRWLQPVGMAAGLILATLLFVLRTGSNVIELLDGSGFFLRTESLRVAELTVQSQKDLLPGNLIWTNEYQRLRFRLKGEIAMDLAARGLLTVEPVTAQNEGILSLHSGKVAVGRPGTPHRFVLNTVAGVVRGEAGRIDISARWLALPEKRWKAAGTSDSWSEAWRAVPIARVDVTEGHAEIALREATAGLAAGQSAAVSTVFEKPILLPAQEAETAVQVASIPALPDSQPRIESQLVHQRNLPLIETVFVHIPLRTVLSSVADVHPSQIELDQTAALAPQNLRVLQPLDSAPEAALAAVADFSGMTYRKELRFLKTELVDLASKASAQTSAALEPQMQVEIEGESLRLLKGTGIRLSVLSRAIEDSLNRAVEPLSVDWALAEFELRDIPKSKVPEVLGRELGLHFSQENRQVPFYRLEHNAAETNKTPGSARQLKNLQLSPQDSTLQPTFISEPAFFSPSLNFNGTASGTAHLTAERRRGKQSTGKRQNGWLDWRYQDAGDTAVAFSESFPSNVQPSGWLGSWAFRGGSLHPPIAPEFQSPRLGEAASNGNKSAPMNSTAIKQNATQDPMGGPSSNWRWVAERAMKDWSGELDFSRRLIFNLLPAGIQETAAQEQDKNSQQHNEKLVFGIVNSTPSAIWVRADIKDTQGSCLDSAYVEIHANSSFVTTLADLFPGIDSAARIAYIETESVAPVAGLQAAVYSQHVELLRAQAVPLQRYFLSPLVIAGYGTAGFEDTSLKLVNASETYQHIRIFLLQGLGIASLPIHELDLDPHATSRLSIGEMLRLRGLSAAEGIEASLVIETDRPGLVGYTWSLGMSKASGNFAWPLQAATCDNLPAFFASSMAGKLCRE